MTRRPAIALSLALTVVVSFAVASFASQAGWLGGASAAPEVALAEQSPPPTEVPPPTATVVPTAADPVVVTEYVYVDVPVELPATPTAVPPTPTAVPPTPVPTQPTVPIAGAASEPSAPADSEPPTHQPAPKPAVSAPTGDDGHDDGEHDGEHEDHDDHEEHEGHDD